MADELKEFTLRLEPGLHRALKVHCALKGVSMNACVTEVLLEKVAEWSASDFDAVVESVRSDYRETLDILAK